MKHLSSTLYTAMVLLLCHCVRGEVNAGKFVRRLQFSDYVCTSSERSFVMQNLRSRTQCALECMHRTNCTGVYYVANTRYCVGCDVSFTLYSLKGLSVPEKSLVGSLHLELKDCLFRSDESCYFLTEKLNFRDAAAVCTTSGSLPTQVQTATENAFIKSRLLEITEDPLTFYLGVNDIEEEKSKQNYGSDTKVTFLDWLTNLLFSEPNTELETLNCSAFSSTNTGGFKWINVDCEDEYRMLCEKDMQ